MLCSLVGHIICQPIDQVYRSSVNATLTHSYVKTQVCESLNHNGCKCEKEEVVLQSFIGRGELLVRAREEVVLYKLAVGVGGGQCERTRRTSLLCERLNVDGSTSLL